MITVTSNAEACCYCSVNREAKTFKVKATFPPTENVNKKKILSLTKNTNETTILTRLIPSSNGPIFC